MPHFVTLTLNICITFLNRLIYIGAPGITAVSTRLEVRTLKSRSQNFSTLYNCLITLQREATFSLCELACERSLCRQLFNFQSRMREIRQASRRQLSQARLIVRTVKWRNNGQRSFAYAKLAQYSN